MKSKLLCFALLAAGILAVPSMALAAKTTTAKVAEIRVDATTEKVQVRLAGSPNLCTQSVCSFADIDVNSSVYKTMVTLLTSGALVKAEVTLVTESSSPGAADVQEIHMVVP